MTVEKDEIVVNEAGESIHHRVDGEKFLVHGHTARARHAEAMEERKATHATQVAAKHARVAAKKERQASKGWPSDKSPI